MKCKIFSGSIFYTFPPPSVCVSPPGDHPPPSVCVSPPGNPPLRLCFASVSPPPPAGPLAGAVSLIALHQHALVSRGCGLLTHEICTSSPTPAPATKSHLRGTPGENNHHTRSLGQATHKPTNRHQSAKTNSNDNSHKRIQQKPQQTTNKNINQKKRQSNKPSNVLK